MALSASGVFGTTLRDQFDASQIAFNWTSDTIKGALFDNSLTLDYSADTGYGSAPYNAGEISGTGYTVGGATLASKTLTSSSGLVTFDAADLQWTSATIASAYGLLIYDDTLAANNGLCTIAFGGAYSVTNGTFNVVFDSAGIVRWDFTP